VENKNAAYFLNHTITRYRFHLLKINVALANSNPWTHVWLSC